MIYLGLPRVQFRRGRDLASLILRLAIFGAADLRAGGDADRRAADKLAVVFLVDVSDSVGRQAQEAEVAYVQQSLAAMRPDDEAAVVVFGGNALVERPMSSVRELAPIRSTPNKGNTDLEEAIGLGLALYPGGRGETHGHPQRRAADRRRRRSRGAARGGDRRADQLRAVHAQPTRRKSS